MCRITLGRESRNALLTTSHTPANTEVCFTLNKALSILELC